ncbi:MAG TPA: DegT/DnrJ/EryC1/StrS family aminotransferase [Myxococcales bacterium]|nr:DegT/DnrJ/EryC1/StrS family aminotransferase [Myxococcales bacterium]
MSGPVGIPLVDLQAQHRQVADEVRAGLERIFATGSYILGQDVTEFEEAFARFIGVPHCVGVANGTDAIELVLRAADVGPGDEVLLPANTFIATALAVSRAGARPVLVDVEPRTQLLDPARAAERRTSRTKAVIAVHLYGQMAPVEALQRAVPGLTLIEDAAQAQGATRNGAGIGAAGLAAPTSFYPSKNLGAAGDAGAVLTRDGALAKRIRALRNYGSEVKYFHPELGFNSRLDSIQAVVLSAKLKHLAAWNQARREAARRYDELLGDVPGVSLPATLEGNQPIFYLYVVRVPRRDQVLARLQEAGIGAGVHYPVPIHLQGAFRHLGHHEGDFPETERAAKEILSLPMFAEITPEQQLRVAQALRAALAG